MGWWAKRLRQIQLASTHLGLAEPDAGKVVVGETVVFGHYNQEGGQFNPDWKVIDAVQDIADWIPLKGGANSRQPNCWSVPLPHAMHHQHIRLLSGSERKRLLLRVLMRNPNFLVMDEPTNDLDIFTLSVLEEFLMDFSRLPGGRVARQVLHGQARGPRLGGGRRRGHRHSSTPATTANTARHVPSRRNVPKQKKQPSLRRPSRPTPLSSARRLFPAAQFKEKLEFEALDEAIPKLEARRNEAFHSPPG